MAGKLSTREKLLEMTKGAFLSASLMLFWFLPSLFALIANKPYLFQRLGTCAILWAVIFFTLNRRNFSKLEEMVRDSNHSDSIKRISASVSDARTRLIPIEQDLIRQENSVSLDDDVAKNELADARKRIDDMKRMFSEADILAIESVKFIPRGRMVVFGILTFEIVILCVGTIQSGFGDWMVCSVNSWSLSTCLP